MTTPVDAFTNKELADQLVEKAHEQQVIIDDTLRQLDDSRNTANALYRDLGTAQADMQKVGQERDGWKTFGQQQELKVATLQSAVLRRNILIGVMASAIAAYLFVKFYLRLPI